MANKQSHSFLGWVSRFWSPKGGSQPESLGPFEPSPSDTPDVTQFGNLVKIGSLNFLGKGILSANQRWLLAYGQIHDPRASTWSSDDPTGAVILFDCGIPVCRLDGLWRPKTVAVCDAGVFAVYEWGPASEFLGPQCSLQVFTATGERIFRHRAAAAIELPALSADGKLLAFHTLAAPQGSSRPEDGERVFLVDLESRAILWQLEVPVIWPTEITFDDSAHQVLVRGQAGDAYRYTYDGEFLDEDLIARLEIDRSLTDEYGYQLFERARALLDENSHGELDSAKIAQIADLLRAALEKMMSPNTKANAHRILGELSEAQGDFQSALKEYSVALELNPKIGLKRRVKALSSTNP